MHEDCAAKPLDAGSAIVIENNDDVIKVILAPEPFGARSIRMRDRAVVIAIVRCVTPAVARPNGPDGEAADRAAAAAHR
jgi:hypothetical protein